MWFPLADFKMGGTTYKPQIDTGGYRFVHVLEDIQSLNQRLGQRLMLEITAISIHQYPFVADRYALTSCGSSMGDNYGPMIVAPAYRRPGLRSSMTSATSRSPSPANAPPPSSRSRSCWARAPSSTRWCRLIRSSPQSAPASSTRACSSTKVSSPTLTQALACIVDLGKWWKEKHGLPLPLGGNAIRRDLGSRGHARHRAPSSSVPSNTPWNTARKSVKFALNYARDMGQDLADKFVGMYVNKWTLDYGPTGRLAVNKLLSEGAKAGLIPDVGTVDFVDPG